MKSTAKITVLGKKYPFKFGFKFQRLFMEEFDIEKITDYQKKLSLLESLDTNEAFKVLGVFIISAINAAANERVDLDLDDVITDVVYDNPEQGLKIFEIMQRAFTQASPKNEKPRAVAGKKSNVPAQ